MTYEKALELQERAKAYGSILGLDNIRNLMQELDNVQDKLNIVHIAGTNGKGSVSCFLASVLQEAGYLVGQYNSPAVFDLREVYKINGTEISKESYAECMESVNAACERLVRKGMSHPTVFEMETAIAFLYFYKMQCEIVLLETGMGGSTDATNLIKKPLCSVMVSVSMDHMSFLGDTLEEIAKVKSGIIKNDCPIITVEQLPEAEDILVKKAKELNAEYRKTKTVESAWIEKDSLCYIYPKIGKIVLSMLGYYQIENSALAIETAEVLKEKGFKITLNQLKNGLKKANWKGRFECVHTQPLFYIDGAHNVDAIEKLKQTLIKYLPSRKRIGIMGVMEDKSYKEMLEVILPLFECIYTVTPDNPRALSAKKLAEEINKRGGFAIAEDDVITAVEDACEAAKNYTEGNSMIVAFGSLYYLKEVKQALQILKEDTFGT